MGTFEVTFGEPESRTRVEKARVGGATAELTVETVRAQHVMGFAERPALGQCRHQHAGGAGDAGADLVVGSLERLGCTPLGFGHLTRAQRKLGRIPRRDRAHAARATRCCLRGEIVNRPACLGHPVGHHQREHAQVVGRALPGVRKQEPAVHRLKRERRRLVCPGRSKLGREQRSMREDDPADQRVGRGLKIDRGRKPGAVAVTLGDRQQRIERRGLDRGSRLGLGLECQARQQVRDPGVVAAGDAQGGEP